MKKPLAKSLSMALAMLLLIAGNLVNAQLAAGEDAKPVVTVAFSGFDGMMNDVKTFSDLAGRPEWVQMLQGGIALGTQGRGVKGLDKSRPWGVMIFAGESESDWPVQAFLPVDDMKALMKAMPAGADGPLAPDSDGVYEIPAGAKTFYAAQKGKWARATDSRDALKTAIEDPTPLIGGMAKKYLLAVRVSIKNIPQAMRDKFMPLMRFGLEQAMRQQQQGNENEDQAAAKAATAKQALDNFERMSKEVDDITWGVGLDKATNSVFTDFEVRFIPGTELAKQCEKIKKLTTRFAGLLTPELGLNMIATGIINEDQSKYYKTMLAYYKATAIKSLEDREDISKDQQAAAKSFMNDAFEVFDKTAELKKTDFGMKLDMGDSGPSLVAAAAMADGLKLEATIKKLLAEVGKDHPEIASLVKLDVEKYEGINFHVATLPVKDEEAAKILGKTTDVAIGINDTTIYIAAGKEPVATIKKAIDDSAKITEKAILPTIVLSLIPIAKFASEHMPEETPKDSIEQAKKFHEELAKTPGKDHVTMSTQALEHGSSVRVAVEPGVIKAIGAVAPGGPAAP